MRDPPQDDIGEGRPAVAGALSALLQELALAPARLVDADLPAFRAGDVVGRFELVREIGRGGFGVVFEARDLELGRTVALKALRPGARPEAASARLVEEAEAAARLSHPNIVTLHDVGRAEQGAYLVLELLQGETLAARLERGPVPLGEALRIGVQVAMGLAHAHGKGVVHRDLAPGNVFMCRDGQVKVLDFGMAHAFGRPRVEGGTPEFVAPEQRRGAPEDERTDVFALGVIFFRMLADELPPSRSRRGSAPALRVPEAPELAALVGRMTREDPVERPRDGSAVLAELAACQQDLARRGAADGARPQRKGERRAADAAPRRSRRRSIAVLPFVNMSPDPEQEYFSDGLAEEILNALAQVEGLQVAGRSSSFAFKGKAGDLREIGQKLGVATVLEGSVRKSGTRVRISAQLVDVADGFHLWSQTFDRELTDIFAVQDEIAAAAVRAFQCKLRPARASAAKPRAAHADAYRHFLLGRQQFQLDTAEGYRRAAEEFDSALALDPRYPPALGWRGVTTYALSVLEATDTEETHRIVLDGADRALAIAPDVPELLSLRGWARLELAWDWAGAKADLERALALAPGDAPTQLRYAHLLAALGSPAQAIAIARKVTEIDPLSTDAWWNLSSYFLATGELGLAEASLLRALAFARTHVHLLRALGFTYLLQGRPDDALRLFQEHGVTWIRLTGEALAQHDLGRAGEARHALERLIASHSRTSAYQVAQVYAWWRELDSAFAWLDRSYANRDPGLHQVRYDPLLRNVRGDPRYPGVLRTMRLPVD